MAGAHRPGLLLAHERNPEKSHSLILNRVKLPKRPMGLYESTVLDTTERKIPWYYIALAIGLPATAVGAWHQFSAVEDSLRGEASQQVISQMGEDGATNGAPAKVGATAAPKVTGPTRESDYVGWLTPRIGGQPWTAPAYDRLGVPMQPPRIFCASAEAEAGPDVTGTHRPASCTCLTEQGTRYVVEANRCAMIAKDGQYEPFLDEVQGDRTRLDEATQRRQLAERSQQHQGQGGGVGGGEPPTETVSPGATISAKQQVSGYGDIGARRIESASR